MNLSRAMLLGERIIRYLQKKKKKKKIIAIEIQIQFQSLAKISNESKFILGLILTRVFKKKLFHDFDGRIFKDFRVRIKVQPYTLSSKQREKREGAKYTLSPLLPFPRITIIFRTEEEGKERSFFGQRNAHVPALTDF